MDLRIASTPALIGIQTTHGKLEIKQPTADMQLNIEHPRVEIQTEQGQIHIDQYQCFAEAGLKNALDLAIDNTAYANQKLSQAVSRMVEQGDAMVAALHRGTDMIAIHAQENVFARYSSEFDIGTIPKSRPEIDFSGGTVEINVIEGRINPQVQLQKPIIDATRTKVDIYLRQRNSINIEYVGKRVNTLG